ncbi:MAG: sugar phosphate isomerase/epimerase [Ruminococcaceae bacterium]|nr:sugar phosphate isomerase/epimerase [Oscillospiraceae bacterium]
MKKGINIWSFPQGTIKDSLTLAKKAGFEGVELALNGDGELSLQSTESEIKQVKKMADDLGLALYSLSCGLCWDYRLSDDNANVRQKAKDMIKKQLETAKILGADTILALPGVVNVEFSMPEKKVAYDVVYNRGLEALNELKADAEAMQVNIGLENVWNKFLLSPMEMRDFIDKIGSDYVGSYLDIGNTLYCGYPEDWVRILGSRIKKVHFKDYRLQAGGLHGFVDLLAGDVDYPEVVKALNEIGYDDWVSAEMIPNYKNHTDAIIYNTSYAMDRILGRK